MNIIARLIRQLESFINGVDDWIPDTG